MSFNLFGAATINALIALTKDWGAKGRYNRPPPEFQVSRCKPSEEKANELGLVRKEILSTGTFL